MIWLKRLFGRKQLAFSVTKAQKELLEFFITNKTEFDTWLTGLPEAKIRFQFFYPTAIDFHYGGFRLFTAYFKKNQQGGIELSELKMTETNFDTIRNSNWKPFETVMLEFITGLEEGKKTALFEKRRELAEYELLCAKSTGTEEGRPQDYLNATGQLQVAK